MAALHHGYERISVDGKRMYKHRYLWEAAYGPIPKGMYIDHINGVRHDNRLENLRLVDRTGNARNSKLRNDNSSGVVGVHYHKQHGKWNARIGSDSKRVELGLYDDWFEAVCARKSAENKHGYHKNHGRIV